jgi:mannitol/fructose-specific phosphotransferase system IIA component (Ntr-type)
VIRSLLSPSTVLVRIPGHTKEEVIGQLVDLLQGHPAVIDLEMARRAVFIREELLSTGVGFGLGLPHAKSSGVSAMVAAFGVTEQPVEFDAMDGRPVRLLFLLVGPEDDDRRHVRVMGFISRLMSDPEVRQRLLRALSAEEVLEVFERAEKHPATV